MKLCTAVFPSLFFKKNEAEINQYFQPHNTEETNLCTEIDFEIEHGVDLSTKIDEFLTASYLNVPMHFWQEQDIGGYSFSAGANIYILPDGKKITVYDDDDYGKNKIDISLLEKINSLDELKAMIQERKKQNPKPDMIPYYKEFAKNNTIA